MNDTANLSFASNGLRQASKASFASLNWGSEIMDQGLLFGALLSNLSAATGMALSEETFQNLAFFFLRIHR